MTACMRYPARTEWTCAAALPPASSGRMLEMPIRSARVGFPMDNSLHWARHTRMGGRRAQDET